MSKQTDKSENTTSTYQKRVGLVDDPSSGRNHVSRPYQHSCNLSSPLYSFCTAMGQSMPWEIIIPATCFGASAVCWYDPNLFPSIAFTMLGFFVLFFESILGYFTGYTIHGIGGGVADATQRFIRNDNAALIDNLSDATAYVISKILASESLFSALKLSTSKFLSDKDIAQAMIHMVQASLITASMDDDLQRTVEGMTKTSIVAAVSDQSFLKELMKHIVDAIVASSKDESLKAAITSVVRDAVREAFGDEELNELLKNAIGNHLSDGSLYRAAAKGIITAPFASSRKN